jgi:hypothetical protein
VNENQILFEKKIPGGVRVRNPKQVKWQKIINWMLFAVFIVLFMFTDISGWYWAVLFILLNIFVEYFNWRGYDRLTLTPSEICVSNLQGKTITITLSKVLFFDYYTPPIDNDESSDKAYSLIACMDESQYHISLKNVGIKGVVDFLNELNLLGFQITMMNERLEFADSSYFRPV